MWLKTNKNTIVGCNKIKEEQKIYSQIKSGETR